MQSTHLRDWARMEIQQKVREDARNEGFNAAYGPVKASMTQNANAVTSMISSRIHERE